MKYSDLKKIRALILHFIFGITYSFSNTIPTSTIFQSKFEDVFYEIKLLTNERGNTIGFYFTIHNTSSIKDYEFYFEKTIDSAYTIQFNNCQSGLVTDTNFNLSSYNSGQPKTGFTSSVSDYSSDRLEDSLSYDKIVLESESSYSKFLTIPNNMKEKFNDKNLKIICSAKFYFQSFIYVNKVKIKPTKRIHKDYFLNHLFDDGAIFNFYGTIQISSESFSQNNFKYHLKSKNADSRPR